MKNQDFNAMHDKRIILLTLLTALLSTTARAQYQYRYWFDQDAATTVSGTGSGTWSVDASALPEGFHSLRLMVSESGSDLWSTQRTLFFVKAPTAADLQPMTYVASVDAQVVSTGIVDVSGGTAVVDVDLSSVPTGFHALNMVLLTRKGVATDVRSAYFWRLPTGGNHIIKYEYWLNDGDNFHSVNVSSTDNPYLLEETLDLGDEVFSSRRYAFVVADGKAYAWAKNRLTVRFYDVDFRSTETTKDFIDFRVGGQLGGPYAGWLSFEPIVPGASMSVAEPAANTIHWFQTYVEKGDSVTLKASRPCMLEAYAPDGTQMYATENGYVIDGFRVKATGTHYIALHDVATQNGYNVSLTVTVVNEPKVPTHISNNVSEEELQRTETFAPDGTAAPNTSHGMRIVRKTYSNGTTTTVKRTQ